MKTIQKPLDTVVLSKKCAHINFLFTGATWFIFLIACFAAFGFSVSASLDHMVDETVPLPVLKIFLIILTCLIVGLPLFIIWIVRAVKGLGVPKETVLASNDGTMLYFYSKGEYVGIEAKSVLGYADKASYQKLHYYGGKRMNFSAIISEMLGYMTIKYRDRDGSIKYISTLVEEIDDAEEAVFSYQQKQLHEFDAIEYKSLIPVGKKVYRILPAYFAFSLTLIFACMFAFGFLISFAVDDMEYDFEGNLIEVIIYSSLILLSFIPLLIFLSKLRQLRKTPLSTMLVDKENKVLYYFDNKKYQKLLFSQIDKIKYTNAKTRVSDKTMYIGSTRYEYYKDVALPEGNVIITYKDNDKTRTVKVYVRDSYQTMTDTFNYVSGVK